MTQLTGLNGKRVLVTAAASCIGLSIASSFSMAGAKVCVCDNDATVVAGLEEEHADLHACVTDVSQPAQVEELFNEGYTTISSLISDETCDKLKNYLDTKFNNNLPFPVLL